jgi:hypothetical protein
LPLDFEHVTVFFGGLAPVARGLQLDWVLVRVNTIRYIVISLIVVVVAAVVVLLGYRHLNPDPDERARRAIERAEQLREQVMALAIPESWAENVVAAEKDLDDANTAYAEQSWAEAESRAGSAASRYDAMLGVGRSQLGGAGHFHSLEGRVQVQRPGKADWQTAQQRMPVYTGDFVRTGRDGAAEILFEDGSLYRIGPNSLLEIHRRTASDEPAGAVKMVVGRINVYTSDNPSTVTTDAADTRISSDSRVAVGVDEENRRTTVATFKGRALVRNLQGLEMSLGDREQVAAATDGTFSRKQTIPDPPLQVDPHNNAGFDITQQRIIRLNWRRPTTQNAVHLQVSRSHRFITEEIDVDASLAKDGARLEAIAPGTYFWRVATIGAQDLRSEWSAVRRFRIFSSEEQTLLQDTTPPMLEVNPPHQLGNLFILEGRTEVGATVAVNGEVVRLDAEGRFRKTVEVIDNGWNDLIIESEDPSGNRTERRERVFVEVY